MEKFSLYDFLGLLLPGVLFLFFLNLLFGLYGLSPILVEAIKGENNIVISLSFALIVGAILYASNFYLVKRKWYNRLLGIYKHITLLYLEVGHFHKLMNETLNKRSNEWYNKSIFFNLNEFKKLSSIDQFEITNLQDEYYSRMYYELEYHKKNEYSKTFHCFYFFFRQIVLACLLLLLAELVLFVLSLLPFINFSQQTPAIGTVVLFAVLMLFMLIASVQLARWYRKRMVKKMYWTYFTHIQQTNNSK